jgi:hypothetical protein
MTMAEPVDADDEWEVTITTTITTTRTTTIRDDDPRCLGRNLLLKRSLRPS